MNRASDFVSVYSIPSKLEMCCLQRSKGVFTRQKTLNEMMLNRLLGGGQYCIQTLSQSKSNYC